MAGWETCPSYFDTFIPHYLEVCAEAGVSSTVFIVGRDAVKPEHHARLRSMVKPGMKPGITPFSMSPGCSRNLLKQSSRKSRRRKKPSFRRRVQSQKAARPWLLLLPGDPLLPA
ncbi:MAG: hypothetical protein QM796_21475 [Chthoniobacteraceae bacterium]